MRIDDVFLLLGYTGAICVVFALGAGIIEEILKRKK